MSAIINLGRSFCEGIKENFSKMKSDTTQSVKVLREGAQTGHGSRAITALKIAGLALTVLLALGAIVGVAVGGFFAGTAIGGTVGAVIGTILGVKLGGLVATGIIAVGVAICGK